MVVLGGTFGVRETALPATLRGLSKLAQLLAQLPDLVLQQHVINHDRLAVLAAQHVVGLQRGPVQVPPDLLDARRRIAGQQFFQPQVRAGELELNSLGALQREIPSGQVLMKLQDAEQSTGQHYGRSGQHDIDAPRRRSFARGSGRTADIGRYLPARNG